MIQSVLRLCSLMLALMVSPVALSATFQDHFNDETGEGTITLKGKIEPDAADDFYMNMLVLNSFGPYRSLILEESLGGDLAAAMEIGELVRDLNMTVIVLGKCASSCALIALAAKSRVFQAPIGLHRPYFPRDYFASLPASEAEDKYRALSEAFRAYLANSYIADDVIARILRRPSDEIWWLSPEEARSIVGSWQPPTEEYLLAACKMFPKLTEQSMCMHIKYGELFSEAVEEQFGYKVGNTNLDAIK